MQAVSEGTVLNIACAGMGGQGEGDGGRGEVQTQHSLAVIYRLGQAQIDSYARNVNGIETFDGEAHFQT